MLSPTISVLDKDVVSLTINVHPLTLNSKNFVEKAEKEDALHQVFQEENADQTQDRMVVNTMFRILISIVKILMVINTQEFQKFKFMDQDLAANALTVICQPRQTISRTVSVSDTPAAVQELALNFKCKLETVMLFARNKAKWQFKDTKGQLNVLTLFLSAKLLERSIAQETAWVEANAKIANAFAIKDSKGLTAVKEFSFFLA